MKAPARILAVVVTTLVVVGTTSASAWADSPATDAWPAAEVQRSNLEWLLYFGGGTVGLFVVVALFGLLTARNNYVPPAPSTDLEVAPGTDAVHH